MLTNAYSFFYLQRKSVFQSNGVVGTKNDGVEDLHAGYMWGSYGFPDPTDDDMRL